MVVAIKIESQVPWYKIRYIFFYRNKCLWFPPSSF